MDIAEAIVPFRRFELVNVNTGLVQSWCVVFPDGRVAVEQRNNMLVLYPTVEALAADIGPRGVQHIRWID